MCINLCINKELKIVIEGRCIVSYLENAEKAGAADSINPNDLTLDLGHDLVPYVDLLIGKIKELRMEMQFPKIHVRYGICLKPREYIFLLFNNEMYKEEITGNEPLSILYDSIARIVNSKDANILKWKNTGFT
jgi:flagellar biosynthesis component FlhA